MTACGVSEDEFDAFFDALAKSKDKGSDKGNENSQTPSSKDQTANEKEKEDNAESENRKPASGIRPEFQKSMDNYKAFFQSYADFMKKYRDADGNDPQMMNDYLSFMGQYSEMLSSLEKVDEQELSDEELKLYLETNAEIQKILAGAI